MTDKNQNPENATADSELSISSGWLPIETAPQDGTDILTSSSNTEASVRYWGEGEDGDDAWQPRIRGCFPKWWMPILPLVANIPVTTTAQHKSH